MKFVTDRPFADPEAAMRKIPKIANAVEPIQDTNPYREDQWPRVVPASGNAGSIGPTPGM